MPLGEVSPRLKGVVARCAETVLVGKGKPPSGKAVARPVVVSALPEPRASADEVHVFVEILLANGLLDLDGSRTRAKGRARAWPTHAVRAERGKKVLVRVRFR